MKTLPLSEVKAQLSKLVDEVASRDEQVTITRNGRPAAMLVSPDEFEGWAATIEIMRDPEAMAAIQRGLRNLEKGRVLADSEVAELFGVTVDEVNGRRPASRRAKSARRRQRARR